MQKYLHFQISVIKSEYKEDEKEISLICYHIPIYIYADDRYIHRFIDMSLDV